MARLATGVVTGQLDNKFGSIRVGDTVKCLADGLEYIVDGYCGIRNESGAAFKVREWKPSEFEIVHANPEQPAERKAEEERPPVAATISPTLEDYSDERLRAELERRGFAGTLTKTVTLTLGA